MNIGGPFKGWSTTIGLLAKIGEAGRSGGGKSGFWGKHGGWQGPMTGGAEMHGPLIGPVIGGAGIRQGTWQGGRGKHIGRHGGLGQGLQHGRHTMGQGGGGGFLGGGGGGGGGLEQQQQQQAENN